MKKFLAIFLSLLMALSLAACGNKGSDDSESKKKSSASDDKDGETEEDAGKEQTNDGDGQTAADGEDGTEAPEETTEDEAATAPENGKVSYGGLTVDIPEAFTLVKSQAEESPLVYQMQYMRVMVILQKNEMDLKTEIGYYQSFETFMDGLYYDGDLVSCTDNENIGGRYTAYAEYQETDGTAAQRIWMIQTTDDTVVTLRLYETNPAGQTAEENAAVDALVQSIRIG